MLSMLLPRARAKGEINGKSANLNNVLKNVVYSDNLAGPEKIPLEEVVVVFDADMQAKRNFFCKVQYPARASCCCLTEVAVA